MRKKANKNEDCVKKENEEVRSEGYFQNFEICWIYKAIL